ncbi:MAG: KR domain-containing protein [Micromonosporaceae bacterium]
MSAEAAHRLGLRGPAVDLAHAEIASLVAVHLACRAIRGGECEAALAGGVEIGAPGYRYQEDGRLSPDGRVRPFDVNANGVVPGSGAGVVLLRPLPAALAAGDPVHAVILGSAIDNAGAEPREAGQVDVIEAALRDAGVDPATIGHIEADGAATIGADRREIVGLTAAYGGHPHRVADCSVSTVKANVGHLGAAAGVCGLIDAVHSVRDGVRPPCATTTEPNPQIDFTAGPFSLYAAPAIWPQAAHTRRAAVNACGAHGGSAHVVIEQPPESREERRRVPLPPYPYQRQRFPLASAPLESPPGPEPATESPADGPCYVPVWREAELPTANPAALVEPGTVWLVFAGGDPAIEALARRLGDLGAELLVVGSGKAYQAPSDHRRGTVRVGEEADYQALLADIAARHPARLRIVHAWSVGAAAPDGIGEPVGYWLDRGFFSLVGLLRAAADQLRGVTQELCVVSSDMQDVVGDGRVEPAKAAVLGVVKTAPKEHPALACRSIDIGSYGRATTVAEHLLRELASGTEEQVAYRGDKRWTWGYATLSLPIPSGPPAALRDRGVYVITGGLGALGLLLAEHLARSVRARLVLLGRDGLPDRRQWRSRLTESTAHDPVAQAHDPVADRIRGVRSIEQAGGEVLVCAADVADLGRMTEVRAAAERTFGRVDGVFHLAASPCGDLLHSRPRAAAEQVFASKVTGAYVVERVFRPELLVLYSSISAVSGDLGLGDHSAANAVLDAFAQRRWASGRDVVAIDWPAWTERGVVFSEAAMEIAAAAPTPAGDAPRPEVARGGVSPTEGLELLSAILEHGAAPRVICSPEGIAERLRRVGNATREERGPRTRYAEPRSDTERALATLWAEALRLDRVGLDDDFIELGGDSLVAVRLIGHVGERFVLDPPPPVQTLYEAGTVRRLAEMITAPRSAQPPPPSAEPPRLEVS